MKKYLIAVKAPKETEVFEFDSIESRTEFIKEVEKTDLQYAISEVDFPEKINRKK